MGELERSRYEIYQRKSDMILKEFTEDNKKYRFDIIYLDPPYEKDESNEILYILENKILEENSLIVYETDNEGYVENVRKLEKKGILEILKIWKT